MSQFNWKKKVIYCQLNRKINYPYERSFLLNSKTILVIELIGLDLSLCISSCNVNDLQGKELKQIFGVLTAKNHHVIVKVFQLYHVIVMLNMVGL